MSRGLTDADKQRLVALKHKNANGVADCQRLRNRYARGHSLQYLADENESTPKSIRYHLRGECECGMGGPVVETVGHPRSMTPICPHDECGFEGRTWPKLTEHIRDDHGGRDE